MSYVTACALAFLVAAAAASSAHAAADEPAVAVAASTSAVADTAFTRPSTGPLSVPVVLARFEEFDRELRSLSAHYSQALTVAETGMTSMVDGTVSYSHPDRLRIEHLRPERQTVVADGKDIWIHRHSRRQVIQSDLAEWKKADPTVENLMQFGSYAKMLRSYDVALDTAGARPVLVLVPKKKDEKNPFELRLSLNAKTLFPEDTELRVGSLRVRTSLSRLVFNPKLDAALFRFTPPLDADVFRDFKPPSLKP